MKFFLSLIAKEIVSALPRLVAWIYEQFEAKKERKKVHKRNKKAVEDVKNAKTKDETRDALNRMP